MQLNHYLNFQGQAEQAFNFYKSVFGGEFAMLSRYGDMPPSEGVTLSEANKNLVLHVSLPINEYTVLMASDTNDQFCAPNSVLPKAIITTSQLTLKRTSKKRLNNFLMLCL